MTDIPDLGAGGNIAAAATGGVVGVYALLQVITQIRKTFSSAEQDKQQGDFQSRTLIRVQELEKKLEDLQSKYTEQSIALGAALGERNALKNNYEEMVKNKDYWRERALSLEKVNADLDKAADILTTHLIHAQMRLSVYKGDLDPASLSAMPLLALPDSVKERLESGMDSSRRMSE